MKKIISIVFLFLLLMAVSACASGPEPEGGLSEQNAVGSEAESQPATETPTADSDLTNQEGRTMKISVKSDKHEIIYELNDSRAAAGLYEQLPLTAEVEPFSNNEMTFYPEKLDVTGAPLSKGENGSLAYYEPWGDVVMFYAPCTPNSSLYELGEAVSGAEHIRNLSGTITVSAVNE